MNSSVVSFAADTRIHIGMRLLPFLFLLYIVNYVDRTNVAYAALGMSRDLGFNDRVLGFSAGVFFLSYVALQVPGALLVQHWSARRMIAACMIAWGSLTALTALVQTPAELYGARFVIGAAEAGFFPGVIVYLSHWFIRQDRAKATSNFMGAIPLSSVLGSPLAGWILARHWFGVVGWRWLFVIEGLPAVLLGAVAFFFLTDWPREANWLNAAQRQWIEVELETERSAVAAQAETSWRTLRCRTVLLMVALTFFNYFVIYTFLFWLPTLLKRQSGLSDEAVGVVGAIPFIVAFISMQINGWHSDKNQERRWHSAIPLFVAAGALFTLLAQPRSTSVWVGLFTLVGVSEAYLPVSWTIPTEMLTQSVAAASVGVINALGSIAGFAGPYLFGYVSSRTGSSSMGIAMMLFAALAGALCTLCISKPGHAGPISSASS